MKYKEIKNWQCALVLLGIYMAFYLVLFTPELYDYEYRSYPPEDWAVAKPSLRWKEYPFNRVQMRENKYNVFMIIYKPLIALDERINRSKYHWRAGEPIPEWGKSWFAKVKK